MDQSRGTLVGERVLGTVAYMGGIPALIEHFTWAWTQMLLYNCEYVCGPGERIHYDRSTISFHSTARNILVNNMQGDWLFMTDTDHSFEPDMLGRLLRLMNIHNLDVLTGLYVYKIPPFQPTIYQYVEERKGYNAIVKWDGDPQLLNIDSSGAGALLVRRRVFARILDELKEGPFDIERGYGEDHSFYRRLQRLEIPAYCAVNVESAHINFKALTYSDDFDFNNVTVDRKYQAESIQ